MNDALLLYQSLGQKFDVESGRTNAETVFNDNTRSALISLKIDLEAASDQPDNDFSPHFKITANSENPDGPHGETRNELLDNVETLKKIRFLSVERDGVAHTFPLRIGKPTGLAKLRDMFKRYGEQPVISITGLDGKERSFHIIHDPRLFHEEQDLRAARPAAEFIAHELARVHP